MTHAFFKALLFLGAGAVIHAMHHEQDMRKMGGLYKKIPVTYALMFALGQQNLHLHDGARKWKAKGQLVARIKGAIGRSERTGGQEHRTTSAL